MILARSNPSTKTQLAIAGTGSRGITTWGKPVVDGYSDHVEFVALCDINPKRMAVAKVIMGVDLKMFEAKDFDLMIQETKPDIVIVTTTDSFHEKCIIRRVNLGKIIAIDFNQTLMPYEGQFIGFACENGRLDVRLNKRQPWEAPETEFQLTKDRQTTKYYTMKAPAGGHGGSDERLKNAMFLPPVADPLGCKAGSRAGIMSSLVGIAARQSIETGQKVKIADLMNFPGVWRG